MIPKSNLTTMMRRELSAYFNSPIAYIFLFVFSLLLGSLFMSQFFLVSLAEMRIFFHFLPMVLCVFLPAVAMRLWAEDKRGNTYELLMTFPMKPYELVVGKFIASLIFYLLALGATLVIPLMLNFLGKPDPGPIMGGYVGAALMGAMFLSIGIFVSGFFKDQIIAFVISMLSCFSLYLIGTEFIASSIDSWLPGIGTFLRVNLGMARHFAGFQRGVIDLRDVLYFAGGSVIFLVLNGFWIEGRMRPKQGSIFTTAIGICLGIFLLGNWFFSDISLGRFDLTEGKIYTVSPVTKKILSGLKAPVTIKYYVSSMEKMPTGLKTLEQDVVDKLDEFRVASKGKLTFKVFPMEASNVVEGGEEKGAGKEETLEQKLQQKGIQPFQVQSIDADEVGVKLIYSAIAIGFKEKPDEILPRIIPDNLDELEYLLVSKIYRMTLAETPKIGVIAPEREMSVDPQMQALMQQMGQAVPPAQKIDEYRLIPMALEYEGYQTERIDLKEKSTIPDDIRTLVVLEPTDLTDDQRFQINKFLVQGGSLFLAAQNYLFEYAPAGRGSIQVVPQAKNPGVGSLLEPWGLGIEDQFLMDEKQEILSISSGQQMGPFQLSIPLKLPVHVRIDPEGMNHDLSITSRLPSLLYLWGSALKVDAKKLAELKLTDKILLSSSRDSWMVPSQTTPLSPFLMRPTASYKKDPFTLAVFVQV